MDSALKNAESMIPAIDTETPTADKIRKSYLRIRMENRNEKAVAVAEMALLVGIEVYMREKR